MKLSLALVACNENTHYLDYWPLVKYAWAAIVGIPCVMVYVGDVLPENLQNDSWVLHFKPISGWPTATQAQIIRLLYPGLWAGQGVDAVILSDMDIVPLQSDWFVKGLEPFADTQFVSLRGIAEQEKQIYMCYVAAKPETWSEVFGIHTEEDIRMRMKKWASQYPADGKHGGKGWCTDQLLLYERITEFQRTHPERVGLVPWTKEIPRVDRTRPSMWYSLTPCIEENLKKKQFVDFHMPPIYKFEEEIKKVLRVVPIESTDIPWNADTFPFL